MSRFPHRSEIVRGISLPPGRVFDGGGKPGVPYLRVGMPPGAQYFHNIPTDLVEIARIVSLDKTAIDIAGLAPTPPPPPAIQPPAPARKTDSSELLYAILSRIWVDGEPALSLMRESEIGDTDGDTVKEIIDVWGNPIYFRIELRIPVMGPDGEGLFPMSLDEYSAWMTRFTWNGQVFVPPLGAAPEVFTPERVRVRVYSSNIESNFDPDVAFAIPLIVETM